MGAAGANNIAINAKEYWLQAQLLYVRVRLQSFAARDTRKTPRQAPAIVSDTLQQRTQPLACSMRIHMHSRRER